MTTAETKLYTTFEIQLPQNIKVLRRDTSQRLEMQILQDDDTIQLSSRNHCVIVLSVT